MHYICIVIIGDCSNYFCLPSKRPSMKTYLIPVIICLTSLISSSPVSGQSKWSGWQVVQGHSQLQYRLSTAKPSEDGKRTGYYVEVKNESGQRVWFTLYLIPSVQSDRHQSQITLKPATRSVVGLFWASSLQEGFPDVQFEQIRYEPAGDLMSTVAGPK